jgi:hypothetical protein
MDPTLLSLVDSIPQKSPRSKLETHRELIRLAAACMVGLAVVMQFYHPGRLQRWTDAVFWIAVAFVFIDYIRTLLTLRRRK